MRGFDPEKMKQSRAEALANQPRLGFRPRGSEQERGQPGPGLGFGPTSVLEARKAQAQNQAPDTIPGMFKPGEFVLPPDTVHAMGGAGALQAAVDATHTPAPDQAFVPRGFKPKVFFANGGDVEEQRRLQGINSPSNTYPGNRTQGSSGISGAPNTRPAPAAPALSPVAPPAQGFSMAQNNREVGQSIKDSWSRGDYGEAVGKTVAGSVGMITTPLIDGAARGGAAAWEGAKGFGRGLVGADSAPASAATSPDVAKPSTPPVTPAATTVTAGGGSTVSPNFSAVNEFSQAPVSGAQPDPSQIAPGVYRSGNSYADSAQGAALGNQPRGLPSRRNDVAGENLAAQSTARGFTPGQRTEVEQPRLGLPGFRTPTIAHSGNDWQSRNDLRNAEVSASSITNTRRFGGRGAENSPDMQRYRAMLGTDAALRQAQPGMEAETMRQNAGLMREDMQQAGGLQREAMQQAGETGRTGMRVGIEQQRLQGEAEARGFKTRAQRQEEQLRNTLLDPNATPQQKQQAQQTMRAIRGDADPSPWKVTVTPAVKNADGSTSQGSIIRHNAVTGEVQQVDAAGGATQPSANHVAALRANPAQAAMFDEIYGKGAAARIIASR